MVEVQSCPGVSTRLPVQVEKKVEEMLKEVKLAAIVCVAGGWAGGNAASSGQSTKHVHILFYV